LKAIQSPAVGQFITIGVAEAGAKRLLKAEKAFADSLKQATL
jgi:hypothetical protein